jgi:CheY-like chemotaxis protein
VRESRNPVACSLVEHHRARLGAQRGEDMDSWDGFVTEVRDALRHLYDYRRLENHPLALRFYPEAQPRGEKPSRAHRLNRLLLESIEALNPPGAHPREHARARLYSLLVYRYVEERPVHEIVRELAYSRSEFFRDQREAILLLSALLREHLPDHVPLPVETTAASGGLEQEVARIAGEQEVQDVTGVVAGVLRVIGPLAAARGVHVDLETQPELPPAPVNRTLLRQVLLNSLTRLVSMPGAERIDVRVRASAAHIIIESGAAFEREEAASRAAEALVAHADTEVSRRLVGLMGGEWRGIRVAAARCAYRFDLPLPRSRVLLAIEDNDALVQAFRIHLGEYGYNVVGAATSKDALRLAQQLQPVAITLDVLLPTEDGWDILLALKQDPSTRDIPVIVCSVLSNPELATSLGAAAYLEKPVSGAALLAVVERLLERTGTSPGAETVQQVS